MRRLYGLDALRGVAACVVAFHHCFAIAGNPIDPRLAQVAVDIFFVLSGFVMARTYEARLRDGLSPTDFLKLRYRRLFLPLAIGTTIGLVQVCASFGLNLNVALAYGFALAFLPAFWVAGCFVFNVPAWSLFLEIVSNAVHGAVLAKLSIRILAGVWVGCSVAFVALLYSGWSHWGDGILPILSCLPRVMASYLAGILIFRIYGDKPLTARYGWSALVLVLVANYADHGLLTELGTVLVGLPILIRACLGVPGGQWSSWLGAASYPLYATHVPVMHSASGAGASMLGTFVAALTVAGLVTAITERQRSRAGAERSAAMIVPAVRQPSIAA